MAIEKSLIGKHIELIKKTQIQMERLNRWLLRHGMHLKGYPKE